MCMGLFIGSGIFVGGGGCGGGCGGKCRDLTAKINLTKGFFLRSGFWFMMVLLYIKWGKEG